MLSVLYHGNLKILPLKAKKGGVNMAGNNINVVHNGDKWQVKQENATHSSGNFDTQRQAFDRARKLATKNGQEVAIHELDGKIREKHSYGSDPFPPEG